MTSFTEDIANHYLDKKKHVLQIESKAKIEEKRDI
jgi:hypothetical protein